MRVVKKIGPGFIAALAGFEITNIVMSMKFGAVYGASGLIISALMIIPLTYLQQVVLIATRSPKSNIISFLKNNPPLYTAFNFSIITSSLFTAYANIIGISIILSLIYGSHWLYYSIAFMAITWLVLSKASLTKYVYKVLSATSLTILIYVFLFIKNFVKLLRQPLIFTPIKYFDILALWGASAAPYSIVIQVIDEEDDYSSIYAGTLATITISLSIASLGYIYLYPSPLFTVSDTLKPLYSLNPPILILYSTGLCSIVFMTLTSTYMASRVLAEKISGTPSNLVNLDTVLSYTLLAGIIITLFIGYLEPVSKAGVLYTKIIVSSSAVIGVLFTIPLAVLTLFYMNTWRQCREKLYLFNTFYLSILTAFSTVIGVMGLADMLP